MTSRSLTELEQELFQLLYVHYPFLRPREPAQSAYDQCGIEVGPGWLPLLIKYCDLAVQLDAEIQILQIKEKFGRLRIYASASPGSADDALDRLADELEAVSYDVCELCGGPGGTRCRHHSADLPRYVEAAIERLHSQ